MFFFSSLDLYYADPVQLNITAYIYDLQDIS